MCCWSMSKIVYLFIITMSASAVFSVYSKNFSFSQKPPILWLCIEQHTIPLFCVEETRLLINARKEWSWTKSFTSMVQISSNSFRISLKLFWRFSTNLNAFSVDYFEEFSKHSQKFLSSFIKLPQYFTKFPQRFRKFLLKFYSKKILKL